MSLLLAEPVDVVHYGMFAIELKQNVNDSYYVIYISAHQHAPCMVDVFDSVQLNGRWSYRVSEIPSIATWIDFMDTQTDAFIAGLLAL